MEHASEENRRKAKEEHARKKVEETTPRVQPPKTTTKEAMPQFMRIIEEGRQESQDS